MKLIDAHAHIFSHLSGFGAEGEFKMIGNGRAIWASGREAQVVPEEFKSDCFTYEMLLRVMDSYNIEKAVLLQGGMLGFDNLYNREAESKYPDRFRSAATIDPFIGEFDKVLENLISSLHYSIFKFEVSTGCGLMGSHGPFMLNHKNIAKVCSALNEIGGTIAFDIGHCEEASHQTDVIKNLAKSYRRLEFVICHLGSPKRWQRSMLSSDLNLIKECENISYDLAALHFKTRVEDYPYPVAQDFARLALNTIGSERLMWGTDIPSALNSAPLCSMISYLSDVFKGKDQDNFFYKSAERIYKL